MSVEATPKGETTLLRQACDKFLETFGRSPVAAASAPGRVNLIGDHVDYCEGFVLPVTLPFVTIAVGSYNNTETCNVLSVTASGKELRTSFPADQQLKPGEPAWANYVKGVFAHFPSKVNGFDVVIVSDLPMGAGLSSSASVEVAFFTFLEALTGISVEPVKKATLCQKAEHDFPGMPCGIMDQYVVTMAQKDHALLIDCRSLESTHIPLQLGDVLILVINSNVKHQLTGSEYPQRRAQCIQAARALGLPSLRDATAEHLQELRKKSCDELVFKRAQHVVGEIQRTEEAARVLPTRDLKRVGELFYQSHDSLSHLMEVSCQELDELVETIRGAEGVYGARMTGGGFGGCVIALVTASHLEDLKRKILSEYKGTPTFFICEPSGGAKIIQI